MVNENGVTQEYLWVPNEFYTFNLNDYFEINIEGCNLSFVCTGVTADNQVTDLTCDSETLTYDAMTGIVSFQADASTYQSIYLAGTYTFTFEATIIERPIETTTNQINFYIEEICSERVLEQEGYNIVVIGDLFESFVLFNTDNARTTNYNENTILDFTTDLECGEW